MRVYAYHPIKGIQYAGRYYLGITEREAIKRYRAVHNLKGKHGWKFNVSA